MSVTSLRIWGPALTLGAAAFIFVTAEMLPVGLLPVIAQSLGESEATTGLLLTIYAWGVTTLGLPLTILTARFDRRVLILAVFCIFICGNTFSALAGTFAMLMAARICIAMSHSIFWAIVPPLSMRVAPSGGKARALGITVTGTSLATVLGVPLGTILGHYFGWRFTFGTVAAVAFGMAIILWRVLPPEPSENVGNVRSLSEIVRNKPLLHIYTLMLLTATGQYATFTYFSPFMQTLGGFNSSIIAALLLTLGAAGVFGSIVGSKLIEMPGSRPVVIPLLILCLLLLLLPAAARLGLVAVSLLVIIWGVFYTFISMVLQIRAVTASLASADLATAIFSGSFNAGVGFGALTGSYAFSTLGIEYTAYTGAAFLLVAGLIGLIPVYGDTKE